MTLCPTCSGAVKYIDEFDGGERMHVVCEGCGKFVMTQTAADRLEQNPGKRGVVSHWIRSANERGEQPEVNQAVLAAVVREHSMPTEAEQADRLLYWLGNQLLDLGNPAGRISLGEHRRIAALIGAFPEPGGALMYIVKELAKQNLIFPPQISQYNEQIGLTPEGWRRFEELKKTPLDTRLAFMAMPFKDPQLDHFFSELLRPAVAHTGYDLRRVDHEPRTGLLDDHIRLDIRSSRFVVADLTHATKEYIGKRASRKPWAGRCS